MNPITLEVQEKRLWGEASLQKENLLPFLYRLHYSMFLPNIKGFDTGIIFMGIIAIIWTLDCFVALCISFPSLKQWRKSFSFRLKQRGYKLNFDIHRSGGVWIWLLLLILAMTSISMNLKEEIVRPVIAIFSDLNHNPFEQRNIPATSLISREQALATALTKAQELGIEKPAGGLFLSIESGTYGIGFFEPENSHGDGGLGNPWIYIDATTGDYLTADIPGNGSAGDIFLQAQFPLHSGRILGVAGRVMMSIIGIVVAALSITGIIIWQRKHRSAMLVRKKRLLPDITAGKPIKA